MGRCFALLDKYEVCTAVPVAGLLYRKLLCWALKWFLSSCLLLGSCRNLCARQCSTKWKAGAPCLVHCQLCVGHTTYTSLLCSGLAVAVFDGCTSVFPCVLGAPLSGPQNRCPELVKHCVIYSSSFVGSVALLCLLDSGSGSRAATHSCLACL